jgi:LysM repeat protein
LPGSGIEQSTQQAEQPEAPSQTTTEPQSYDDTTKAYANNGVDPNNFRVTINAHHGYNVYLTNGSHYVVAKENDSYASIAKLFEISEATLRRYNDVSSTTPLKKGDLVYIERKSARWQGDDMLHIVSEGQTPHILSQIYGIRLSHLLKMNRLRETSTLSVGQSIRLR